MSDPEPTPVIRQVVLDCEDARALAEFYRQLFGLRYRPGDEPPNDGSPDVNGQDWLVLRDRDGWLGLAFQQVTQLAPATWPEGPRPQMLHLDTTVPTVPDLHAAHDRALALGARLLLDRSDDAEEPLFVYADPAGHPFCIFVAEYKPDLTQERHEHHFPVHHPAGATGHGQHRLPRPSPARRLLRHVAGLGDDPQ